MSREAEVAATAVSKDRAREKVIVRTSFIGILANVALAGFKAAVGIFSNSIAVILDAVNNLSDALSSLITIIGAKLAGKPADKKHPYGYGRTEYMSEFLVAAIVLYAGITSLVESVKKIMEPETPSYSKVSLIIIAFAIVVKLILGLYVNKKGESVNSGSLVASGSDAFFDAILSFSVLACAIVYIIFGLSLEPFVGAAISIFIIKSGIEMIKEALDEILGGRVGQEISSKIKSIAARNPEVLGVYDVVLNNYGPDKYSGSLHVEVADSMNAGQIDSLTRKIQNDVFTEAQILILAVGIYASDTGDGEAAVIQRDVRKKVMGHDGVLQMHGFYIDMRKKILTFDVIIDYAVKGRKEIYNSIVKEICASYSDYSVNVTLDVDASD